MKIERTGRVTFGDATINVWEDPKRTTPEAWNAYEALFRKQVFKRIIQQLNRLGWSVKPWDEADQYKYTARNHRSCEFGDLKGLLELSGRAISFKMWQGVNTPNRPDYGGRCEPEIEAVMPYVLRLRMERTRIRLRKYLCNIFSGYTFEDKSPKAEKVGPEGLTGYEKVLSIITHSSHYRPELGHASILGDGDISADKVKLVHGESVVYSFDRKGRLFKGVAYYHLNGNWIVLCGKYELRWAYHNEIYVNPPAFLRIKQNKRLRNQRLNQELSRAVKCMDFLRAETIKNILFPKPAALYMVRNDEGLYHRPNFCGYTSETVDAGKFTMEEIGGYASRNNLIKVG